MIPITGKKCIEVGVREGEFSEGHILRQNPASLLLVDAWLEQDPTVYQDKRKTKQDGWNSMYDKVLERFKSYPQVSIMRGMSTDIAKVMSPESVDFIYIDANHSTDACYADIKAWWPVLRPGGWICGHDYFEPPSWSGVFQAVNAWLTENNRQLDLLTKADKFPTWGVQK